jgi:hypothetical protein
MKAAVLFLAGVLILPSVVAGSDFGVVSITSPPDTVRQHSVMAPAVLIHAAESNSGPELVSVQLRIGSSYLDSASAELAPGEDGVLPFATPWQADSLGAFPVRCSLLTSDSNPSNDTLSKVVTVLARRRDFAAIAMVLPSIVRRGDSVAPTATIHADDSNPQPETVAARLRIGSAYDDTVSKTLNPGASLPYPFKSWHADTLGTFPVRCSLLVQDSVPANDTLSRSVTVLERLVDFAAEAMTMVPPIVHVTDMVTPVVTVHALDGNPLPESVTAKVWIGASFTDTVRKLVPPGAHVTYQFKQWQAESVGTFQYRCSLMVQDSFAFNDTNRISITVYPQGSDFSVVNVTSPPDSVPLDSQVVPTALVHAAIYNRSESVSVRMRIGTAYDHTTDTVIPAGGAINVTFPTWHADSVGLLAVRCSLLTPDNDSTNDAGSKQVHVVQPGGGQPVSWQWSFLSYDTSCNCVQQTSDHGFVFGGYVRQTLSNDDMLLVRTDSMGTVAWTRSYGSADHDFARSVVQTSDGGYVIAGRGYVRDSARAVLYKTDSAGSLQWTYAGPWKSCASSVQQTSDGGYIAAGFGKLAGDSVRLMKIDAQGNGVWTRILPAYHTQGWARITSVQQTHEGGYITCAEALVKTDSLGNLQWNRTYPNVGVIFSVQQTTDGGFVATGIGPDPAVPSHTMNILLLRTDSLGNLLWRKIFRGERESHGYCVRQTADGGFFVTGYSAKPYLIRTDEQGNVLWTKTIDSIGSNVAWRGDQTADGGFIIVANMHLIKLAPASR